MNHLIEVAMELTQAGLSVIPTDAKKIPIGKWGDFQIQIATPDQIAQMFRTAKAIAVIGGKVSGNLYQMDFEGKDYLKRPMESVYPEWAALAKTELARLGHPNLFDKFAIVKTQHAGYHVRWRSDTADVLKTDKLAKRWSGDTDDKGKPIANLLIESKAEGGYALIPPSPGYELIQGSFLDIPTIPVGIHERLVELAKSFHTAVDEALATPKPKAKPTERQPRSGLSPGDDFNKRGDRHALLTKHGWQFHHEDAKAEHWTRPGKATKDGSSAVWAKQDIQGRERTLTAGHFRVFTSADSDLEEGESCDLFGLYARLEHDGNFEAAACALAKEGYGEQRNGKPQQSKADALNNEPNPEEGEPNGASQDPPVTDAVKERTMEEVWQDIAPPEQKKDSVSEGVTMQEGEAPPPDVEAVKASLREATDDAAHWSKKDLLTFRDRLRSTFALPEKWISDWQAAISEKRQTERAKRKAQQALHQAGSKENAQLGAEGDDYLPYTDCGNARRLVAQHGRDLRYIDDWGRWYVWNGKHWKRDNNREIVRRAKETVRAMYAEASKIVNDEQRKAFVKWARDSESKSRLEAMIELAKSEPGIAITPDELDTAGMLLNVKNGTLDLRTGELRKHRREDLISKIAPVEYQPDAKCPLWLSFLDRIMGGNQKLIDFLQRAVGYSLTGDTSEHCLFFMYGSGRNGKTTFVETLKAMLGDYTQKAPTEMLMRKRFDGGIPNDIARLPGARLVVVAEVEEGRRLSESIVKDLTGGDTLTARFLRQEFFDFEPTHKIWMYGNHKPIIRGTDEAIWSRIPLIPFTVFIPPKERDPDLRNKLRVELPGILRWVVEGCLKWQKSGLDLPHEVVKATKEYRDEMDDLADFLDERCIIAENAWVISADLWNAYQGWAKNNGEQYPLGRRAFANRLTARGLVNDQEKVDEKNLRVWRGVRLAAEPKTDKSETDYEEGII